MDILYYQNKADVVAYSLCRKVLSMGRIVLLLVEKLHLNINVQSLVNIVRLDILKPCTGFACIETQSLLVEQIKTK